jgi:hypothetical protein
VTEDLQRKVIRSYRLVFRRRWRIFRLQGWRIPLPGGIELRLIGYWLAALALVLLLGRLPLLGAVSGLLPRSLRLVALPLAAAWGLSRWELDGRPPHRVLLGLARWRLRARSLAGLRPCPPPGAFLAPLDIVYLGPDLGASRHPRGRIEGPARLLLRYPLAAERRGRKWLLRPLGRGPLHRGKTIEIPSGHSAHLLPP